MKDIWKDLWEVKKAVNQARNEIIPVDDNSVEETVCQDFGEPFGAWLSNHRICPCSQCRVSLDWLLFFLDL